MSDDRQGLDPELERRLRDAFRQADGPPAPASLETTARTLAARTEEPARGSWMTRLPFAFAAVAVLVTVGMVSAVLSQGRHSTTQGEEPLTPAATETIRPSPSPDSSASGDVDPIGTVVPASSLAATGPLFVTGRYRSTTPVHGRWCLELDLAQDRYPSEALLELRTSKATDGSCATPASPGNVLREYTEASQGTIGPLDDGSVAVWSEMFVDAESLLQELDLSLLPSSCCLIGIATSFGGERVEFKRVGAAALPDYLAQPPEPEPTGNAITADVSTPDLMPPLRIVPVADGNLPLAGWDVPAMIGCNNERFPFSGLWGTPGAELREGPEYDALRSVMASPVNPVPPTPGSPQWWEAGRTHDWVLFLAEGPRGELGDLSDIEVKLRNGSWQFQGSGGCAPFASVMPDYGVAYWQVDPAFRKPSARTTRRHLLVTEDRCSSGETALGRIAPAFVFTESPHEVRIQLFVRDPGRGQDCLERADPTPVTIELPEPLGDRRLRDGNVSLCLHCGG